MSWVIFLSKDKKIISSRTMTSQVEDLKSLTADQLVTLLSQDVVDILKDSAQKGTAYLVEFNEYENIENPYRVWGKYRDTTPERVPYRIMRDSNLGFRPEENEDGGGIFHVLLEANEGLMRGHKIFEEYFDWLDLENDGWKDDLPTFEFKPELIEYLYTKIKRPRDLIHDLQNVGLDNCCADCFIVFERDSCWSHNIRYRCKAYFGIEID